MLKVKEATTPTFKLFSWGNCLSQGIIGAKKKNKINISDSIVALKIITKSWVSAGKVNSFPLLFISFKIISKLLHEIKFPSSVGFGFPQQLFFGKIS